MTFGPSYEIKKLTIIAKLFVEGFWVLKKLITFKFIELFEINIQQVFMCLYLSITKKKKTPKKTPNLLDFNFMNKQTQFKMDKP